MKMLEFWSKVEKIGDVKVTWILQENKQVWADARRY